MGVGGGGSIRDASGVNKLIHKGGFVIAQNPEAFQSVSDRRSIMDSSHLIPYYRREQSTFSHRLIQPCCLKEHFRKSFLLLPMKLYNCSPFLSVVWPVIPVFTLYTHDCSPAYTSNTISTLPNDNTVCGHISDSDKSTKRDKILKLLVWISANNLTLNTRKTKQIIFDIRKMSVQTSSPSTSVVNVRAYAGLSRTAKTSAVTKKMYNCISPLDVTFTKVRKNIWHPDMRENLSGYSGATQRPARLKPVMKWKLLEHQCHYWRWSKVFFTMGWEGANHERSPCYIFKLDWNLEDGFGMDKAGQL